MLVDDIMAPDLLIYQLHVSFHGAQLLLQVQIYLLTHPPEQAMTLSRLKLMEWGWICVKNVQNRHHNQWRYEHGYWTKNPHQQICGKVDRS